MVYDKRPFYFIIIGCVVLAISTNLLAVLSGALLVGAGLIVFHLRLTARLRRIEALFGKFEE